MASSERDVDWQSTKKTVLERSRHMFNNQFMSDVVLCCEGSRQEFRSHKYGKTETEKRKRKSEKKGKRRKSGKAEKRVKDGKAEKRKKG